MSPLYTKLMGEREENEENLSEESVANKQSTWMIME